MYELKTKVNDGDVKKFLNSITDEKKKADSFQILDLMSEVSGAQPEMWGSSIIGFGRSSYTLSTGEENEWFKIGFSPRKQNISLYLTYGFESYKDLLDKLGKHSTGKSCLYIKKLEDIDYSVLKKIITKAFKE